MLSFASAPGNLFNRWGKLGKLVSNMRSHQLTQLTALTDTVNGAVAQFNAESDLQALIGSAYLSILNGVEQVGNLAKTVADRTVNRMVFRDNPQISLTLTQLNTVTSLNEVIRQMKLLGASVLAMTVTAAALASVGPPGPHFTGRGNGIIFGSTKRPLDGLTLENSFSENLLFTVTGDSYSGSAASGNEPISVTGVGNQSDVFAHNWPLGSNSTAAISAVDGAEDNAAGNLLTNSGFETFTTANTPDNWNIVTGTPGSNIFEEATLTYDAPPNKALRILGDGATVIYFRQQFGSSTGTQGSLDPLTQYAFNIFLRRDAVAAAGTLVIDLVDSTGTVLQDQSGAFQTFSIDLSTLTTQYQAFTTAFRTPAIMPSTIYLRWRTTVPYTNNRSFYLDKLALGEMTQQYTSGPFVIAFSGSVPFEVGDYGTLQISNSRGVAGTLDTFQTLLARLFPDIYTQEILFPSSNVPTITDAALIV